MCCLCLSLFHIHSTTTLILNQALIHLAMLWIYGTVSIKLEPVLNKILFLSRNGFQDALLRVDDESRKDKQSGRKDKDIDRELRVLNIALLPIYLGVMVTLVTITCYTS